MTEIEVRIVRLEPMRVASFRAESASPEQDAWEKLRAWAEPRGLLDDPEKHPVFGFNNPDPTPDRAEYGYELWIRVDASTESDEDAEVKDAPGGLYAVASCRLGEEIASEFFRKHGYLESWKNLYDWVKGKENLIFANGQWLERVVNPGASESELMLDLHCPVEER